MGPYLNFNEMILLSLIFGFICFIIGKSNPRNLIFKVMRYLSFIGLPIIVNGFWALTYLLSSEKSGVVSLIFSDLVGATVYLLEKSVGLSVFPVTASAVGFAIGSFVRHRKSVKP
jgi:hypothetical protein